jgi:Ca2+-binding RTX toxin-like protein
MDFHNSKAPRYAAAAVAALGAAALALPAGAAAKTAKVDGVRAAVEHGTLEVDGGGRANAVTLRQSLRDPSLIEVDVGNDGTADFSFQRSALSAIDVEMGAGADSVRIDDSNGALTDSIPTTISGNAGDDSLNGGLGAETFRGGPGDDDVLGGRGNDTALLGPGDDTFVWNPGDGSDTIDGQNGTDTMLFNGANVAENVTMTADGGRLIFFRNVASITMVTDGVETVDFNALGGADSVTVNDLTGTDVTQTNLDLAASGGGGDSATDTVTVNGTDGDDKIDIAGGKAGVDVTGLATAVSVHDPEATDVLSVDTAGGDDKVHVDGVAGVMQVLVDGLAA